MNWGLARSPLRIKQPTPADPSSLSKLRTTFRLVTIHATCWSKDFHNCFCLSRNSTISKAHYLKVFHIPSPSGTARYVRITSRGRLPYDELLSLPPCKSRPKSRIAQGAHFVTYPIEGFGVSRRMKPKRGCWHLYLSRLRKEMHRSPYYSKR